MQPRDRLNHRAGRDFAAVQNKIAQRNFVIRERRKSLVNARITSAHQHHALVQRRIFTDQFLRPRAPLWSHHHHMAIARRAELIHRREERFHFHHHAVAAAISFVVDRVMDVVSEFARVESRDFDRATADRLAEKAFAQKVLNELWKQSDDGKFHFSSRSINPCGRSIFTSCLSKSMLTIKASTKGTRASTPFSLSTRSKSCTPLVPKPTILPKITPAGSITVKFKTCLRKILSPSSASS